MIEHEWKKERWHERTRPKQVVSLIVRQLSPSSKTYQTSSSSLAWTPKTSSICLPWSVGWCFMLPPHPTPNRNKKGNSSKKVNWFLWFMKISLKFGVISYQTPFFKYVCVGNLDKFMPKICTPWKLACKCQSCLAANVINFLKLTVCHPKRTCHLSTTWKTWCTIILGNCGWF